MAVRLINLHQQPLRIDLRGGGVLVLAAGERSAALREELLYDNCHLPGWARAGWIARVPARMSEVLADAVPVAAAAKKKAAAARPNKSGQAAANNRPARKAPAKTAGKAPGKKKR